MPTSNETIELAKAAAVAAKSKLGENLVALDVSEPFVLAEIFLMISADNERQVQSIASHVEDELFLLGVKAKTREGRAAGRWILLDFGDLIVHVMHEEEREFYGIERLWLDCPVVPLDN